jgi:type IV pilus assembly protein PilB
MIINFAFLPIWNQRLFSRMLARRLGELLERNQLVSTSHVQECMSEVDRDPTKRLTRLLLEKGYIQEQKLIEFFSKQYGMPLIDLTNFEIDPDLLAKLTPQFCSKHLIIPVGVRGDTIVMAMADPTEVAALDQVRFTTRLRPEPVIASPAAIRTIIEKYTGVSLEALSRTLQGSSAEIVEEDFSGAQIEVEGDELNGEDAAPIIQFVTAVLTDAIRRKASDVHIEPYESDLRVRIRLDGDLLDSVRPPLQIRKPLIARIKVMARMRLDEKRLPQDGRIRFKLPEGKTVDFRVSTLPTVYGEKIVIRILDKTAAVMGLEDLGFEPEDKAKFVRAIQAPWGMCLVAGATGSGKTTSLYAALNFLNKVDVNISTIEDPVEYNFTGINQCQVHEQIGFSFSNALRSFLRQDPDIILVGEIRDSDTADIAMKAALTGHLVLSTLHTNDAASTLARLKDLKIEPFLINSALRVVVAQRLIRKICKNCKSEDTNVSKADLLKAGFPEKSIEKFKPMRGKGCSACRNTGYAGRRAIYEVMEMSEKIRETFGRGGSTDEIRKIALSEGMKTLKMNTMKKMIRGETTLEELKLVGESS